MAGRGFTSRPPYVAVSRHTAPIIERSRWRGSRLPSRSGRIGRDPAEQEAPPATTAGTASTTSRPPENHRSSPFSCSTCPAPSAIKSGPIDQRSQGNAIPQTEYVPTMTRRFSAAHVLRALPRAQTCHRVSTAQGGFWAAQVRILRDTIRRSSAISRTLKMLRSNSAPAPSSPRGIPRQSVRTARGIGRCRRGRSWGR